MVSVQPITENIQANRLISNSQGTSNKLLPIRIEPSHQEIGKKLISSFLPLDKPIVFFDVETTGLEGNDTRIVEISLVKIHPNGLVESCTQKINPEMEISEELTKIHGISNEDVKDSPIFKEIADELNTFLSDSHLGGYNVFALDVILLDMEFKKAGIKLNIKERGIIDVMKIFHRFVPPKEGEKRRLIDACKLYLNKDLIKAHQAEADIITTIEILIAQFEKYKSEFPKDIHLLGDYCKEKLPEYIDSLGKLVWRKSKEGKYEIYCSYPGPKHRGELLVDVIKNDRDYILWMLEPKELDFSEDLKQILRDALNGIFPELPKE